MKNTTPHLPSSGKKTLIKGLIAVIAIVAVGTVAYTALSDTSTQRLNTADSYWAQAGASGQTVEGRSTEVARQNITPSEELETQARRLDTLIGVDLNSERLYRYENGSVAQTYPLQAGSGSEIPNGEYEVGYRNDRHLSPNGSVYLPHSQQFGGRFLIHGWPQYPGGQAVASSYENDYIRLSSADAATLFAETEEGTPVVVTGGVDSEEVLTAPTLRPPIVSAKSYIVADIETGHTFAQKRAGEVFPIASITKLMTAVVANENIAYNDTIYISDDAVSTYGRAGGLRSGERLTLEDLYLPLLLESSNDAAAAIAEHHGSERFLRMMNRKALALDMGSTQFYDPSGLSNGNRSSARDLLRLARYIYNKKQFILDLTTSVQETTPDTDSNALRNFTNNNPIAGQVDFLGGKNGYTDNARHTLLSVFETEIDGETRQIVIIVLGSESHAADTRKLLTWLKQAT